VDSKKNVSPNGHVYNGTPTPEATPRLFVAGVGGATAAKTCDCAVCTAKLRQSLQLFEGALLRGVPCLCADEVGNIYSALLFICRVLFFCWTAPRHRRERCGHQPGHHDQERANMLISGRRRQGPRRGFIPQAQSAQQRLKHVSAPPYYGKLSSFLEEHRRERYLASVQMQLVFIYSALLLICLMFFSCCAAASRGCW
jgi:hypothetical protein